MLGPELRQRIGQFIGGQSLLADVLFLAVGSGLVFVRNKIVSLTDQRAVSGKEHMAAKRLSRNRLAQREVRQKRLRGNHEFLVFDVPDRLRCLSASAML